MRTEDPASTISTRTAATTAANRDASREVTRRDPGAASQPTEREGEEPVPEEAGYGYGV